MKSHIEEFSSLMIISSAMRKTYPDESQVTPMHAGRLEHEAIQASKVGELFDAMSL